MNQYDQHDRALGCVLGLAVGDALGTTVEFRRRGSFPVVTDMIGGGPFQLRPGQWTDDTSMALCLAESLLHDPYLDEIDLMQRFLRWFEKGYNSSTDRCFDIGTTTRGALSRFKHSGNALAGSTDPRDAGNGSIMRLAPVVARWCRDPVQAEEVARRQSVTTHGTAEAVDACALLARILCAGVAGAGRNALEVPAEESWAPAVAAMATGSWRGRAEREIQSTGYVIHTLEAALWAVERTNSFEEAVLTAVNLGDDADTVAAVAGQVAGAIYGASAIPLRWRERLHEGDRIEDLARALHTAGERARGDQC